MSETHSHTEIKLADPPSDGTTALKFQPGSSQLLIASSWDGTVRLYDVTGNVQRSQFNIDSPVLDCCFSDAVHVFTGGVDPAVRIIDCNTGQQQVCGYHSKPVRCVHYNSETNCIITGGWDSTVKLWDPRVAGSGSQTPTSSQNQPETVYSLDTCGNLLVVATAQRRVAIWDLRHMSYCQQERESSLKYQTRCVRCFPNGQGFAISSIEGRVAVEFFDPSPEAQKQKYAFKCHRVKNGECEEIHPVNAIAFHRQYNTFATGGSDCMVNIWDGFNRKRLVQLRRFPTSISSLAFSDDGSALAIAASFLYEREEPKPADDIFVRFTTDQEVKPKSLPSNNTN